MFKKLFFLIYLVAFTTSFANRFDDFGRKAFVRKNRSIEVLNFYEPVIEQSKFRNYGRYEHTDDYKLVEWTLAEGYIYIGRNWDLEYDIQREFHYDIYFEDEDRERDRKGWNNLLGFTQSLERYELLGKTWAPDIGFLLQYDQLGILGDAGEDFEKTELALRYRMRTDSSIGMGGTYWGADFWTGKVFERKEDGYSLEANLISFTNWGYGFQTSNILYNEFYNYGEFEGTYYLGLENETKWTYELNKSLAFSVGVEFELDKYNGGSTTLEKEVEIIFNPHFLYNLEVVEGGRIFGEIGLPGYRYAKEKYVLDSFSSSGIYFSALIGVQLIW